MTFGTVFAEALTPAEKEVFYDNFERGLFYGMEQSLSVRNISAAKIKEYVSRMKTQYNRKDVENKTWACVSQYSTGELASKAPEITEKCFTDWVLGWYKKNEDLVKYLQ